MKRKQSSERGASRLRMTFAFIAGMAVTAVLAQTPVVADIFTPGAIHEPVPALPTPDSPKTGDNLDRHRVEPCMSELVQTTTEDGGSCQT